MARVNIEDQAWPRITKLAAFMGITDREAAGTLYMLWRESQDVLALYGSAGDILDWAHLFNLTKEEASNWIAALTRARIISLAEGERYLIHGNEIQIEGRMSKAKTSAKGGAATKAKWEKLRAETRPPSPHSAYRPKAETRHITGQDRTGQDNAIQVEEGAPTTTIATDPDDSELETFLADIPAPARKAWVAAYGEALVRDVLPRAWAGWLSDPHRQLAGGKAKYLRSWLENAKKDVDRPKPGAVKGATLEQLIQWDKEFAAGGVA